MYKLHWQKYSYHWHRSECTIWGMSPGNFKNLRLQMVHSRVLSISLTNTISINLHISTILRNTFQIPRQVRPDRSRQAGAMPRTDFWPWLRPQVTCTFPVIYSLWIQEALTWSVDWSIALSVTTWYENSTGLAQACTVRHLPIGAIIIRFTEYQEWLSLDWLCTIITLLTRISNTVPLNRSVIPGR